MQRACRLLRPSNVRHISGVAPTIYIRPKTALKTAAAPDLRPRIYALQRFAQAELKNATGEEKARIEKDIERYQNYLETDLELLKADIAKDTEQKLKLIPLLDRYPEVSIEKIPQYADVLMKKINASLEILSRDVGELADYEAYEAYFETSKFHVLNIYTGIVATIPEGDVPAGAIECLPGQIIHTKVNGEEVMLEVDEIDPGFQVCWFKPEVPLPENADVLWSYPYEPTAVEPSGTTWEDGQADILVPEAPKVEEKKWPVKQVANPYASMAEKLAQKNSPELKALFNEALLHPSTLLPLATDYGCTYDREIVESKRDRYLEALVSASQAPPLPYTPDLLQLKLEHNVVKGQLIDSLRAMEYQIATEQLQARLHERRLRGDVIDELEALDYNPLVRDDVYLENDFGDPSFGRYIWKLFPHMDGDEDCLLKDDRLEHLPPDVNPLNAIMANQLRQTPTHQILEKRLWSELGSKSA